MNAQDRELTEAAARAACFPESRMGVDGVFYVRAAGGDSPGWRPFNPLADDGDALRLAVDLQISIQLSLGGVFAGGTFSEANDGDPFAAARRAIVRAAAALDGE